MPNKNGLGHNPCKAFLQQPPHTFLFWPADFVPKVFDSARVLAYGPDAEIFVWDRKGNNMSTLDLNGEELWSRLELMKTGNNDKDCPIIFVAHGHTTPSTEPIPQTGTVPLSNTSE